MSFGTERRRGGAEPPRRGASPRVSGVVPNSRVGSRPGHRADPAECALLEGFHTFLGVERDAAPAPQEPQADASVRQARRVAGYGQAHLLSRLAYAAVYAGNYSENVSMRYYVSSG